MNLEVKERSPQKGRKLLRMFFLLSSLMLLFSGFSVFAKSTASEDYYISFKIGSTKYEYTDHITATFCTAEADNMDGLSISNKGASYTNSDWVYLNIHHEKNVSAGETYQTSTKKNESGANFDFCPSSAKGLSPYKVETTSITIDKITDDYVKGTFTAEGIRKKDKSKFSVTDGSFCVKLSNSSSGNSSGSSSGSSSYTGSTTGTSSSSGKLGSKGCTKCGGSGKCQTCGGSGSHPCSGYNCHNGTCGVCGGSGYVYSLDRSSRRMCTSCTNGKCRVCHGSGKISCTICNGSGNCNKCHGLGR